MTLVRRSLDAVVAWLDSSKITADPNDPRSQRSDPMRWVPYLTLHAGVIPVIWVGWSWTAVWVAVALYFIRMFAVTGIYHRYFSHRTYQLSRFWQFVFAVWGNSASQRGPLWWAAQHRHHHKHSDTEEDAHSPIQHGFYWSHIGWLTARSNLVLDLRMVPDLAKFPELVFLNRFDLLIPVLLGAALYGLGAVLAAYAPQLGTNGPQMLVWGFFISTVVLFHCTCFINSLAHLMGSRRYETEDHSRNSLILALITLGEGWHNNHHRYPAAVRQGFYWWEIDITYYVLKMFSWVGIVKNLRPVPERILAAGRKGTDASSVASSIIPDDLAAAQEKIEQRFGQLAINSGLVPTART